MKRIRCVSAMMCGLAVTLLGSEGRAATLFSTSGQVALADGLAPDGVKVKLQVDLDRNGRLDSFETLSGTVANDGTYSLKYDLNPKDVDLKFLTFVSKVVADYQSRGFESLLDDGPLPIVLSFEREGYSSVVRRLNSLFENPSLDVTLVPLGEVACQGATCLSPDGGVRLGDFPGGTKLGRAYADNYDPSQETSRFPGLFADSQNNLLVSSGFAEINLFKDDGTAVHQISDPVTTRFEAKRASWATLPDLEPNTGRIELPMYSFDNVSGEWVAEENGELQDTAGKVISEDDLAAIHDGTYGKQLFVGFSTTHFSTFNCDAPISVRACVKGRILAKATGKAMAGVAVEIDGVSYTGSAGALVTGVDGTFATDVRKSELASEDLDANGEQGEILEAHAVVTGTGVFVGDTFDTPTLQGSVGVSARPTCKPDACDCVDLGDIQVEFEEPRLCDITLNATFSGLDVVGGNGPLAVGDAVVGASVRASLTGGVQIPQAGVAAVCNGQNCAHGPVPASGMLSFSVPVIGDAPKLQLDASWSSNDGGTYHYYSGSIILDACTRDQTAIDATAELQLDHSELSGFASFIASLGDVVKTPSGSAGTNAGSSKSPLSRGGCGCRAAGVGGAASGYAAGWLACLALGLVARRRQR